MTTKNNFPTIKDVRTDTSYKGLFDWFTGYDGYQQNKGFVFSRVKLSSELKFCFFKSFDDGTKYNYNFFIKKHLGGSYELYYKGNNVFLTKPFGLSFYSFIQNYWFDFEINDDEIDKLIPVYPRFINLK